MKMIYRAVMFFVDNWQRIADFISSIADSVTEIANGQLDKASDFIVNAIRRTIPIILSFFAKLLGLDGISKKIQETIKKIRKPIDEAINSALDWIAKMVKKIFGKGKGKGKSSNKKKSKKKDSREQSQAPIAKTSDKKKTKPTMVESDLKLEENKKRQEEKLKDKADQSSLPKINTIDKIDVEFKDKLGGDHELFYSGDKLKVASRNPKIMLYFFKEKEEYLAEKKENAPFTKEQLKAAKSYYFLDIRPLEKEIEKEDPLHKKGKTKKAELERQKKAKSILHNNKLVSQLESKLTGLGPKLAPLLAGDEKVEYPVPKLPVMMDNKKASSFTADYIDKDVPVGSGSPDHVGNLDGWPDLQGQKLTDGAKWVRMHLLPHLLGGYAVDSNLTPARGPESNTKFLDEVEKYAKDATEKEGKTIWYKFRISYHSGEYVAFPKMLEAQYGTYSVKDGAFKRDAAIKGYRQNPAIPDFDGSFVPNLNDPNMTAGQLKAARQRGWILGLWS